MNRLRVRFDEDRASFFPGEEVGGEVSWRLAELPETLELRLFYYTVGKGDQDIDVLRRIELPATREGSQGFRLTMPRKPFSFSGRLISILWAVELVANPGAITDRLEVVIGPEKREIRVDRRPSNSAPS